MITRLISLIQCPGANNQFPNIQARTNEFLWETMVLQLHQWGVFETFQEGQLDNQCPFHSYFFKCIFAFPGYACEAEFISHPDLISFFLNFQAVTVACFIIKSHGDPQLIWRGKCLHYLASMSGTIGPGAWACPRLSIESPASLINFQ